MRRTGFKSKLPERQPRLRDREPVVSTYKRITISTYARTSTAVARPKTAAKRNRALLDMAQGRRCLLLAVEGCEGASGLTTVACHSNSGIHQKGASRKADDQYTAWGCAACHAWLDQGRSPKAEKQRAFMSAHLRQVLEWRRIAADKKEPLRFRDAACWALNQLHATEIGAAP